MLRLLAFLRSRGLRDGLTVLLAVGLVYAGMRWERSRNDVAVSRARAEAAEAREAAALATAEAARVTAEAHAVALAAGIALSAATQARETVVTRQATRRAARAPGAVAPSDAERSRLLMDLERGEGFRP